MIVDSFDHVPPVVSGGHRSVTHTLPFKIFEIKHNTYFMSVNVLERTARPYKIGVRCQYQWLEECHLESYLLDIKTLTILQNVTGDRNISELSF